MIRILVAAVTPLFRGALTALLQRDDDMDVVGEAAAWPEVEPVAQRTHPDVAVIDLDPPGPDPLPEVVRLTRAAGTRALMLLDEASHDLLNRAGEIDLYRVGFLARGASPDHLLSAVRSLAGGAPTIDPELVMSALSAPDNPLTERERGVLALAAQGAPVKEIAERMFLSTGSVRNCLSRVYGKTGVNNRIQAIRRAEEAGWL